MRKQKKELSPEQAAKRKRNERQHRRNFLIKAGVIIVSVWIVFTFILGVYRARGNSMFPMVKDGDLMITFRLGCLNVNDVVAYKVGGTEHIGRVIAMAGQTFDINDSGEPEVDGTVLSEEIFYETVSEGIGISLPYTVPEGAVFILSDYRSDIYDSRTYGAVPLEDIDGKAVLIHRRRGF